VKTFTKQPLTTGGRRILRSLHWGPSIAKQYRYAHTDTITVVWWALWYLRWALI